MSLNITFVGVFRTENKDHALSCLVMLMFTMVALQCLLGVRRLARGKLRSRLVRFKQASTQKQSKSIASKKQSKAKC